MPTEPRPVNCLCGVINPLTEQPYSYCPFHFSQKRRDGTLSAALSDNPPIPINAKQQKVIYDWADNKSIGYWGSSDAREHNLTIFARQILASTEQGEYFDLQLMEDALFMAAAVDANSDRAERMRELGERIYKLKPIV